MRGARAVNGTAELMIDAAVRWMAAEHASYVTLGLAPLSTRVESRGTEPWWLRVEFAWLRAHGRRFYNFTGLDAFKAKFDPERWEAVYAITTERGDTLHALYAIAAAFTGGKPVGAVASGLVYALRQEGVKLRSRLAASAAPDS